MYMVCKVKGWWYPYWLLPVLMKCCVTLSAWGIAQKLVSGSVLGTGGSQSESPIHFLRNRSYKVAIACGQFILSISVQTLEDLSERCPCKAGDCLLQLPWLKSLLMAFLIRKSHLRIDGADSLSTTVKGWSTSIPLRWTFMVTVPSGEILLH